MKLEKILKDVEYEVIQGNINLEIDDITYDSRKANERVPFVA